MNPKKAKRIGVVSTFIISSIGVFLTMLAFKYMIDTETPYHFGSIFRVLDTLLVVTLITSSIAAKEIGEEIIIQNRMQQSKDIKAEDIIFIVVSISTTLTMIIFFTIGGFFSEYQNEAALDIIFNVFQTIFILALISILISKWFGPVLLFILELYKK